MFETVDPTRWLLATFTILLLLGGFALIAAYVKSPKTRRSKRRKLKFIESLPLDARHKITLIRYKKTEHLLLLGGSTPMHLDARPLEEPEIEEEETYEDRPIGFLKQVVDDILPVLEEKSKPTKAKKKKS